MSDLPLEKTDNTKPTASLSYFCCYFKRKKPPSTLIIQGKVKKHCILLLNSTYAQNHLRSVDFLSSRIKLL